MSVAEIIAMLGGSSAVARYTGWPVTTVDSWQRVNHVPDWRKPAILRMALETGKQLATTDFPAKAKRPEAA